MDRQEILLKEYEVCQQHNDSIGSQVWTSTSIFMSINVAVLGGVAYGIITKGIPLEENTKWLVLALGLGIISIFTFWMRWLNRMQFLTSINYERMREIEDELGMWKNWMARGLDDWDKLSDDKKKKLTDLHTRYPRGIPWWNNRFPAYRPPRGFEGLKWTARIVMIMWVSFIVIAFIF